MLRSITQVYAWYANITHELRKHYATITQRLRNDYAIVLRWPLRSDYAAITQNCVMITQCYAVLRMLRSVTHRATCWCSWHWLYVVCVCIYMYLKCPSHCMYVYVCVYTCACIVCIVCMCLYVVCIVCIRPGKHWCHHNRPSTPPGEAATSGPHAAQPWAAAPPLYPAVRDPFPDPFWRTRARCTRRGGQSCPPAQPMGPPITMGTWWPRPEPRPSWSG